VRKIDVDEVGEHSQRELGASLRLIVARASSHTLDSGSTAMNIPIGFLPCGDGAAEELAFAFASSLPLHAQPPQCSWALTPLESQPDQDEVALIVKIVRISGSRAWRRQSIERLVFSRHCNSTRGVLATLADLLPGSALTEGGCLLSSACIIHCHASQAATYVSDLVTHISTVANCAPGANLLGVVLSHALAPNIDAAARAFSRALDLGALSLAAPHVRSLFERFLHHERSLLLAHSLRAPFTSSFPGALQRYAKELELQRRPCSTSSIRVPKWRVLQRGDAPEEAVGSPDSAVS
jgi:hypothetical protein